nr:hypothetical protein [Micromonospora sp. DSM 115978]
MPELVYSDDPHLLRRLVRCGGCDQPLACGTDEDRCRTYRCLTCDGEPVAADGLESRVVTAAARRAAVDRILPPYLASALEGVIAMVAVGPGPDDIHLHWRT